MALQRIDSIVFHADDLNGHPLSGGKVYTYFAGGSRPATTYNALGQRNENPVRLDIRGNADIWLDPAVKYKIVVKDALGTTVIEADNVTSNPVIQIEEGTSSLDVKKDGSDEYISIFYRTDGSRGLYDSLSGKDVVSVSSSGSTFNGNATSSSVASAAKEGSSLATSIASKADDSAVVHKSGDETINGEKTFNDQLNIGKIWNNGTATFGGNIQLPNTFSAMIWNGASGTQGARLMKPANPPAKTESHDWYAVRMPNHGGTLAVDDDVVHTSGEENITGKKTFTSTNGVVIKATSGDSVVNVKKSNGTNDERLNLEYDSNGNRGVWDSSANKWIVKVDSSNAVTVDGKTVADDSDVVHKSGAENITGNKSFGGSVCLKTGPLYIKPNVAIIYEHSDTTRQQSRLLSANNPIAKEGSTGWYAVRMPNHGGTLAVDGDVVHNTGEESIAGQKTFNSDPIVQNYDATKPTKIVLMKSNGTDNENIQLRYDTSGKRGLYDNYNSDWIVYCGTDNVPILKGLAEKATKDGAGNTISTYYLSKSDAESKYVNNDAIVTEIEGIGDDSEIPSTSAVMAAINNIGINGTYLQTGSNIDTMHAADDSQISSGFYYLSQSFSYGGTFPDGYNHYGFLEFKRISISGLWIQTFHPSGYSEAVFTRQRNALAGGTLTPWVKSSN